MPLFSYIHAKTSFRKKCLCSNTFFETKKTKKQKRRREREEGAWPLVMFVEDHDPRLVFEDDDHLVCVQQLSHNTLAKLVVIEQVTLGKQAIHIIIAGFLWVGSRDKLFPLLLGSFSDLFGRAFRGR